MLHSPPALGGPVGVSERVQSGALKTARRPDAARTAERGAAPVAFVSLVPARQRGKGTIPIYRNT